MEDMAGIATVSVPKDKALKGGKLKKGCRFSGRGVRCTPAVAARLGIKGKSKGRSKGKKKGTHPCASSNPPAWCNKKRASGGGGAAPSPHAQLFANLKQSRAGFKKASTCKEKRFFARAINMILAQAKQIPAKSGEEASKRNRRYASEGERVLRESIRFCAGAQSAAQEAAARAAFRGYGRR